MLVPLTQGAYTAQSIIASAQRSVNLYQETNPGDSPVQVSHYPTPGLTSIDFTASAGIRQIYQASNGKVFIVAGSSFGSSLYIASASSSGQGIGIPSLVATFSSFGSTPVGMADNGIVLIIVDGSGSGWAYDLTAATFGQITDPSFQGGTTVDYLDTFFLLNKVATNEWYISQSETNYAMLAGTVGSIQAGSISNAGGGTYTNGTFAGTPLTGGGGTGAIATVTVANNNVSSVVITTQGTGYAVGDILSAALAGTAIATANVTVGSGYTNGYYPNTVLTGGTGTGATANITVSGGAVSALTFVTRGIGYAVSDVLTATLPGGSGFQVTVLTLEGNGFAYTVDAVGGFAFDPLDFATKTGYPDPIVTLKVMHTEIWLLGEQTTEIWYNAGSADFPFQRYTGIFIEHGCVAPYSVARQDLTLYWLSQDKQGKAIVMKGNSYAAHRISTFAIENEISKYGTISDAIGFTYQQNGHTFYVLTFPTADKTWVWDESTELWHERASLQYVVDSAFAIDGNLHKVIYNSCANGYGLIYVGDYLGNIWELDLTAYTEDGTAIPRIRSFPHLLDGLKRVSYKGFIADMECGNDDSTSTGDGTSSTNPPVVNLRWSDDRGRTYGSYVQQSLGAVGQYLTNMQWPRLGIARDRVFELSWSVPAKTALNGAWVDSQSAGS